MASRKPSGLDDIAKLIAKAMKSKSQQKIRYEFAKQAGIFGLNAPKSAIAKKAAQKAAASATKRKPPRKGGGAAGASVKRNPKPKTPSGGAKIGRIAKTKPERPAIDRYPKGKSIAQTPSEQRAVERAANRYLKRSGGTPSGGSRPTGSSKPVDVKGSIISPPSKASMRQPKPSNRSYEADPTRRFERTPKKQQQKPRKGNQPKGTKPSQGTKRSTTGFTQSSSVKPKANMSVGKGKAQVQRQAKRDEARAKTEHISATIRSYETQNNARKLNELQAAVRNAKTPQARNKATKALNGFIYQLNKRK